MDALRRMPPGALAALALLALVLLGWLFRGPVHPSAVPSGSTTVAVPTVSPPRSTSSMTPTSGLATIPESDLPTQAARTLALIRAGGPYPYRQDGQTFGNRERILPTRPAGYYREYTVRTPAESDRGPRRIIGGASGDLYWTEDHYASFRQIEVGR